MTAAPASGNWSNRMTKAIDHLDFALSTLDHFLDVLGWYSRQRRVSRYLVWHPVIAYRDLWRCAVRRARRDAESEAFRAALRRERSIIGKLNLLIAYLDSSGWTRIGTVSA